MTDIGRIWSGIVSTATGGLFPADDLGPRSLWRRARGACSFGERLAASPIAPEGHSKQSVAIASAATVTAFGLFEPRSRWSRLPSYSASS